MGAGEVEPGSGSRFHAYARDEDLRATRAAEVISRDHAATVLVRISVAEAPARPFRGAAILRFGMNTEFYSDEEAEAAPQAAAESWERVTRLEAHKRRSSVGRAREGQQITVQPFRRTSTGLRMYGHPWRTLRTAGRCAPLAPRWADSAARSNARPSRWVTSSSGREALPEVLHDVLLDLGGCFASGLKAGGPGSSRVQDIPSSDLSLISPGARVVIAESIDGSVPDR